MSLEKLNDAIGTQADGWHEFSVERASRLLGEFDSELFKQLKHLLYLKPTYWKIRCAEALGELENADSMELLASLLCSDEKDVALIAASVLEDTSYLPSKKYVDCLSHLLDRINPTTETRYDDVARLLKRVVDS